MFMAPVLSILLPNSLLMAYKTPATSLVKLLMFLKLVLNTGRKVFSVYNGKKLTRLFIFTLSFELSAIRDCLNGRKHHASVKIIYALGSYFYSFVHKIFQIVSKQNCLMDILLFQIIWDYLYDIFEKVLLYTMKKKILLYYLRF